MAETDVLRFAVCFCEEDGTWAVIDNHRDGLPFAWFAREETSIAYCEWQNNQYYFPF